MERRQKGFFKFFSTTIVGAGLLLGLPLAAEAIDAGNVGQSASPVTEKKNYNSQKRNGNLAKAEQLDSIKPAENVPEAGADHQYGFNLGRENTDKQALQKTSDRANARSGAGGGPKVLVEMSNQDDAKGEGFFSQFSTANGGNAGAMQLMLNRQLQVSPLEIGTPSADALAAGPFGTISGGGGGSCSSSGGCPGSPASAGWAAQSGGHNASIKAQAEQCPNAQANQAKANALGNMCSSASAAGEDALICLINALDGMSIHLINVANEEAGTPCSSLAISKTYSNAVYMVQKMYKSCFLPMVILFLVPGALMTNTKTMIQFGILKGSDEDTVSPFTGILRSMIAIFLIPATQLIVSYMVDIGNSLQSACTPYVSIPLIVLWAEEQVVLFKEDQQGAPIRNLPNVVMAPWRGKFAGMPIKGAILEQVSGMDAALSELANECLHLLSEGLTITHAFQVVMICYLFLLGPLAAAFFAWPGVGRDLFRRAFATWVDGVVILSLWKFWWNIVLIVMTIRCQSGALNPFDPFEVYYLVAFCCILMFVPFNPFDFKPGEIVSHALEKAHSVASKVAQGGKGGGGGGGGGGDGGGCAGKAGAMGG
ncbi:MAG: hypothetical protein K2X77_28765 [Candidatus Obscuribacterales bacterium]|jgi:hypothetical protein|nr:hypothetical protein [Candidatus Obscuribacterales bacterium]